MPGPGYAATPPGPGVPPPGYEAPSGYGAPAPSFGAPAPSFGGGQGLPPFPPTPPSGGDGSASPAMPPARKKWLVPVLAVVAGLAVAGVAVAVTLMLTTGNTPTAGGATPTTQPTTSATPAPKPSTAKPSATPTAKPTPQPTITTKPSPAPSAGVPPQPGPDSGVPSIPDRSGVSISSSTIAGAVDGVLIEYEQLDASGQLWQMIPDSEGNTYAYLAFRYLLIDMKTAALFGATDDTAREYWSMLQDYEKKLLTQEPLGKDVTIDSKQSYFHYDGTTGEGEYRKK